LQNAKNTSNNNCIYFCIYFLQGSVAALCGGAFNYHLIENFPQIAPVKGS